MRQFTTKIVGAFASLLFALALIVASGQEAKAQPLVTVVPSPPGCCFDIYVMIPAGGFANWSNVDIVRNWGPNIGSVTPVGGVSTVAVPTAGTHYVLTSTGVGFPPGMNTRIGRICLTGGPVSITFTTMRWNGFMWVTVANSYTLNCGPAGPYIVAGPYKDGGYEENTAAVSGTGMTASPNPASGQTVVRFDAPQELSGTVLSISDMTGREVLRVLNGVNLSTGTHEIPVNTESLNSGIYMVNLRSDNGTVITTKFSVLR